MATSSLILQSFLNTDKNSKDAKLRPNKTAKKLLEFNESLRGGDFLTPLSYYLSKINHTDYTLISYINKEHELNKLLHELRLANLLLLAQEEYEIKQKNLDNRKKYAFYRQRCTDLIDTIYLNKTLKDKHQYRVPSVSEGCPMKYLYIWVALEFVRDMVNMITRPVVELITDQLDRQVLTKNVKAGLGLVNEVRLYWVWCSSLLQTILTSLPADFFDSKKASSAISSLAPYTGTMSWGLYYFRGFVNLFLLLKHTIRGEWLSEEEKKQTWKERFSTQWDQRKFTLLNDFVWATGNLVCFKWLTSANGLGTWGDALTLALLVFDIALAIWDLAEQYTKHTKKIEDYNKHLADEERELEAAVAQFEGDKDKIEKILKEYTSLFELKQRLTAALNKSKDKKTNKLIQEIIQIEMKRKGILKEKEQCIRDWEHQKIGLILNLSYAVGLMLAFFVLTMPFVPITGIGLLSATVVGAIVCFAFTVIYNVTKAGMELHQSKKTAQAVSQDLNNRIDEFLAIQDNLSDEAKRLFFMEITRTQADTEYHRQLITYNTVKLVKTIILQTCAPAVVFASLMFLPLGIGIPVVAAMLAIAIGIHFLIEFNYKPKKAELLDFDENGYKRFLENPKSLKDNLKSNPRLFKQTANDRTPLLTSPDEDNDLIPQEI